MGSAGLWISVAGLIVSVAGTAISIVILCYTRSHLRLSERESLRNPQLQVEGISWTEAGSHERVQELARVQDRRAKWESMTDEERESYAAPADPNDESGFFNVRMFHAMNSYVGASNMLMADYAGPVPDLVLSFRLTNQGQRMARDVGGWVYFKQPTLEPIDCPGFHANVQGDAYETWPRLHKGSPYRKGARLKRVDVPPASAEEEVSFNVALVKRISGKCEAKIVFSDPEGDYIEEDISVEV